MPTNTLELLAKLWRHVALSHLKFFVEIVNDALDEEMTEMPGRGE
jgi:hypothetical protein